MPRSLLAALLVLLATLPVAGQPPEPPDPLDNWPHWRGPLINGTAPRGKPPLTWSAKQNIAWKTALPGKGSSTPIVWGDQVFVLTALDTGKQADPKDIPIPDPRFQRKTVAPTTYHQFLVLSLDRATGKERWRRTAAELVPHEGHHDTHSYAAGSPTTDGKRLYVSFGSAGVFCYDLEGKPLWERKLDRMATRLGWGEASTPVIHGDRLYLTWDHEGPSFITALDAATGKTVWKEKRDQPTSWATPLVVKHKERTQVVVPGTKGMRSYDADTGKLLWRGPDMTINCIPSPVTRDGVVYVMSGYGRSVGAAVSLDAEGDISNSEKLLWKIEKGAPYVPSPLLVGDRLYFTMANNNFLTCLDAKTGKILIEQSRLSPARTFYASPVAAAGRIYLVDRDGLCLVLEQADRLKVLATNRLEESVDASPVIVGKQLFLRGEKHVYCVAEK